MGYMGSEIWGVCPIPVCGEIYLTTSTVPERRKKTIRERQGQDRSLILVSSQP